MSQIGAAILLTVLGAVSALPADIQGTIIDWNCGKEMAHNGRAKTLKHRRNCSLMANFSRPEYGLLTSDSKVYKLDDAGRSWALRLLKDTPDKDNLRVVVTGDLDNDTIAVKNMSEL